MFEDLGVFCWSKIGTEAGENLSEIIQRKEIERLANNGTFLWGVGSSLGSSLDLLRERTTAPMVLFTNMLSKAKVIDECPKRIFMWVSYYDQYGQVRALPEYSFVTSRGTTSSETKKKNHYALICNSRLAIPSKEPSIIDGSTLVNLKSGKQVGASQVTSIVKQIRKASTVMKQYSVVFSAELKDEGQVRLAHFIEIKQQDVINVQKAARLNKVQVWKETLSRLKNEQNPNNWKLASPYQQSLPIFV